MVSPFFLLPSSLELFFLLGSQSLVNHISLGLVWIIDEAGGVKPDRLQVEWGVKEVQDVQSLIWALGVEALQVQV